MEWKKYCMGYKRAWADARGCDTYIAAPQAQLINKVAVKMKVVQICRKDEK